MYDLNNKVALVTGAAGWRGFGRAIAVRLASEGADVVVVGRHKIKPGEAERIAGWQGLDSVAQEIQAMGRRSLALEVDITQSRKVDEMIEETAAKLGGIDILVNNAGISGPRNSLVLDMSDEEWRSVLEVNLTGTFFCCRAAARKMVEQGRGGTIVNVASILGKVGALAPFGGGHSAYGASKFGVLGLTQNLALELVPYNIKVNAVCSGAVRTDSMTDIILREAERQGISEEEAEAQYYAGWMSRVPVKRRGAAEDIAAMVAFLCSSESDYVLGQSINVDGGFLMAH